MGQFFIQVSLFEGMVELDRIQTDTIEDKKEAIDYYSCLLTNIADNYRLHRKPSAS